MDLEPSPWEAYSRAKDEMFVDTDIPEDPGTSSRATNKRSAADHMINDLLSAILYR